MGFESSLSESNTATPVSTDTQLIPISHLTPAVQQEAFEKLSQIQGVLDVKETPNKTDFTVTFIPSLTCSKQLNEVLACLAPLEIPTAECSASSPSHTKACGPSLLKLSIEGMTCHSCTTTIEGKVGKLKGVEKIKGDKLDLSRSLYSSVFVHSLLTICVLLMGLLLLRILSTLQLRLFKKYTISKVQIFYSYSTFL